MAWTAPATATVGQILTAAFMNAQLRDNMLAIDALFDIATGSFTDGGILLGSGSGKITAMAVLADGSIVVGDGTTDPVALAAFTSSSGTLKRASGGLEADVSSFSGYPLISGGSTSDIKMDFTKTVAPGVNDDTTDGWVVGSIWVDVTNDNGYVCLDNTDTAAVWKEITAGAPSTGSWTPGISDGSLDAQGDDKGQTYSVQVGSYVKTGTLVVATGTVTISSLGTMEPTDVANIVGLPFTAKTVTNYRGIVMMGDATSLNITAGYTVAGKILSNTAYIFLTIWDAAAGMTGMLISEVSAGASFAFTAIYEASS